MTTKRDAAIKKAPTRDLAKRRAVVKEMLAERDQRQRISLEEIRRLRDEGRY